MRKSLYLSIALLMTSGAVSAQQLHTSHIETLRNEKWWGYYVSESPRQPFETDFEESAEHSHQTLMVSNKGRYIWSKTPFSIKFSGESFTLTSESENLSARKNGSNLREAYLYCVHKNIWPSAETGIGCEISLPVYATGLTTVSAASGYQLLQMAESLHSQGVKSGTLLIADGWRDDHSADGFDKNLYESFRTSAECIAEYGFDVMLTVTPLIPAAGRRYTEALRNAELLTDDSGKPVVIETPRGWYACLDISRKEVCDGLQSTLSNAARQGNLRFYFDLGDVAEFIPDSRRTEFVSRWSELAKNNNASLNSFCGCTAPQWHPYSVSAGELSWERLKTLLRETLYAGITGCIYPYLDLSQTDMAATDELVLLRTLQTAAFMPVAALAPESISFSNDQYTQALRRTATARAAMSDYITDLINLTASTGEPIIRLMEYQFPNQGFANCDDQFMIGAEYLIAPILDDTGKRMVRLPKGTWIGADGTKYKGPRVVSTDVSNGDIPVFRLKQSEKSRSSK